MLARVARRAAGAASARPAPMQGALLPLPRSLLAVHSAGHSVGLSRAATAQALRQVAARAFSAQAEKDTKGSEQGEAGQEVPLEDDIPLIGRIGLYMDAGMKLALAAVVMGGVLYFGYFIMRTILPTSSSPMTIRNDAVRIIKADPDVSSAFGEISRVRGVDGGRGEGRRNYVPSYTYTRGGKTFTRIKFKVDNTRKSSATVFAEVDHARPGAGDFHYLMVQVDRTSKTTVLMDNRKPEKPADMRQYDVATKLQRDSATWYSGGPAHGPSAAQAAILGPHIDYVNTVRCDVNEDRCTGDGYSKGTLVYRGKGHSAPLGLDDLEAMVGLDRYTRGNM